MEETKALILASCRALLKPIARLLLKSGLTWKEFAQVSRTAFVEVATDEFGIRGRPTNVSRVALMTGMTRREVRRQRDLIEGEPSPAVGYVSKASRVLSGWHQDPDFLDQAGHPRKLPLDGSEPNFMSLARRYGGDLPPMALLKELQASGAVDRQGDGHVRAVSRVFLPRPMDQGQIKLWSSAMHDIGATLEQNVTRDRETPPRFERRAINVRVDRRSVPAFRELLETEGQSFLERIDDWLTAHQVDGQSDADPVRLGAGVYHIEDSKPRGRGK